MIALSEGVGVLDSEDGVGGGGTGVALENVEPRSKPGFSGLFGMTTALLRVKILERNCNDTMRFLKALAALLPGKPFPGKPFPDPGNAVSLLLREDIFPTKTQDWN